MTVTLGVGVNGIRDAVGVGRAIVGVDGRAVGVTTTIVDVDHAVGGTVGAGVGAHAPSAAAIAQKNSFLTSFILPETAQE